MLSPKSLGHMAAPADWPVCPQRFLQIFGRDLVPLDGFALAIQQGWRVIVPVDFSEQFAAVRASLPLVPAIDDGPNQTSLWCFFDLGKTRLTAGLPFGPTRATTQSELLFPATARKAALPAATRTAAGR